MDAYKKSLAMHEQYQGKLGSAILVPVDTMEDLALAYTPGVAEPCKVIHEDPAKAWSLTQRGRTVAVVTDGSAVLGLGNIGPEASLPVMEGKAILFKKFGGLDAVPIAIDSLDVDEIVQTVKRIAPTFGGINLEDMSAPRCFEIERKLIEALDIPVMHDDQHGTAIVIVAGMLNGLRVVGKTLEQISVCISGAGAAGIAAAHMLHALGVSDIVVLDSKGALSSTRDDLNAYKQEVVTYNVCDIQGDLAQAVHGRDVFIGLSAPNILSGEMVASMAEGSLVFAMSNPEPEIDPDLARASGAAVVATGRSDFPNQLNNVLAFPGIFKGALAAHVGEITMEMKIAAAKALADLVESPSADKIIPGVFEEGVAEAVAQAIASYA